MEYTGSFNGEPPLKASSLKNGLEMQESGILDTPESNESYTFQFATNIPCPGTPTVTYERQVYNTIQIFSQCWLKENLNVGSIIQGTEEMNDNGIIEKYCYNNEPDSCAKYGGLYQWDEMMQYTTTQGVQGICPDGWHVPTDYEWRVLEGTVDSVHGIGDPEWDIFHWRGFNAGLYLKSTHGWYLNGNGTNRFGFSGLPGGYRFYIVSSGFNYLSHFGLWWSSTETSSTSACDRHLGWNNWGVSRTGYFKEYGYSVRCLKD